jgi:hypothetical protein
MLNVPFTLLAGAALSVALVTAAPEHDMTLNTPAQVTAPGGVADRSPSIEECPRPLADSRVTRRSWSPVLP